MLASERFVTIQFGLESVALAFRHFEVEHQILDIEPKLREGFLNQREDPSAAADGIDDPIERVVEFRPDFGRLFLNSLSKFDEFHGKLIFSEVGQSALHWIGPGGARMGLDDCRTHRVPVPALLQASSATCSPTASYENTTICES